MTAPSDQHPPILTRGLTKRYEEITAVDGLDLEVKRGEIFGLLGQNGAGKTTTILMLLGLTEPTEGTAEVLGFDPAFDALQVKRRVGYLPDSVGFYDEMTGRENLRYTARLNRILHRFMEQRRKQKSDADFSDTLFDPLSRGIDFYAQGAEHIGAARLTGNRTIAVFRNVHTGSGNHKGGRR